MLVKHKVTGQIRDIAGRQLHEYEGKGYEPLPSSDSDAQQAKPKKSAAKG